MKLKCCGVWLDLNSGPRQCKSCRKLYTWNGGDRISIIRSAPGWTTFSIVGEPYDVTQCSQSGSALQKDVGRDAGERDDDGSPGRELPDE